LSGNIPDPDIILAFQYRNIQQAAWLEPVPVLTLIMVAAARTRLTAHNRRALAFIGSG
jgi:hypothetical protein